MDGFNKVGWKLNVLKMGYKKRFDHVGVGGGPESPGHIPGGSYLFPLPPGDGLTPPLPKGFISPGHIPGDFPLGGEGEAPLYPILSN